MSAAAAQNSTDAENTCVVCCKTVDTYSVGLCDHPVCYECSTRMRVLCKQNECPICRTDMPKVIFTKDVAPFNTLKQKVERSNLQDVKYGIYFCSPSIQRAYYHLLEFTCQFCPPGERRSSFKVFSQLREHVRRDHELFYCDLCVENLKSFAFERRCYTRSELAQHRRKGDSDNKSHRGHPLCEFCDQRYMDSDDLFRHLRRDHLYCHFCDADGKHEYYSTYEDLRVHFQDDHYLCEEGDCKNEQFTSVFRTDIDLKAHVATVHSKHLSRAANKQARTLEVEFNFGPRRNEQAGQRGGRRQQNQNRNNDDNEVAISDYNSYNTEPGGAATAAHMYVNSNANFPTLGASSSEPPLTMGSSRASVTFTSKFTPNFSGDEFPTLGGGPAPKYNGTAPSSKPRNEYPSLGAPRNITITKSSAGAAGSSKALQRNSQNFPSLDGGKTGGASSTLKFTLNDRPQSTRPNVSIHVNHKSNGAVTTRISAAPTATLQVRPKSMEAFPALGPSSAPAPTNVQKWVQPKPKKNHEPKPSRAAPAPVLPPSSLKEFPSLSRKVEAKTKKSSTVTMPMNMDRTTWTCNAVGDVTRQPETSSDNTKKDKSKKKTNNPETTKPAETAKPKKPKKPKSASEQPLEIEPASNLNGIIKKTSTLKIGALEVTTNGNTEDFPTLGHKPPPGLTAPPPPPGINLKPAPPGISTKPPPGFNCVPKNSNDLTFTSSSGQSYAIQPVHSYYQPANFTNRNSNLIQNFLSVLKTQDIIKEFKSYSDLFRKGGYPPEKYYEHCQSILGESFNKIFPELLVLLPDIQKQQDLYKVHKKKGSTKGMEECATCKQVIFANELKQHLNNHYMENHFPSLGESTETSNVWKK